MQSKGKNYIYNYLHTYVLLDVTGTSDCFTSKLRVSTAMTPIGTPPSLPRPITTLLPQPGKYLVEMEEPVSEQPD